MPKKIGQNSFEGGLNTDVSLYNTPKNVLIDAKNVTQSTLAEDQFILQNTDGTSEVLYNGEPVKLTEGFVPTAVEVFNNIAYIISVNDTLTTGTGSNAGASDYVQTYRLTNSGMSISYNFSRSEYGISGLITEDDVGTLGQLPIGSTPPIPSPGSTVAYFVNVPGQEIFIAYGNVVNSSMPVGTVLPPIVWGTDSDDTGIPDGYLTEIGTFPSPNWNNLNNNLPSELQLKYSPIHNFKDFNETEFTSPFRALLGNNIYSEIDVELQQSFDSSVNIIFTDGTNPIRLVNSRFKPSPDNPNEYVIADRTDLSSRDTNVYSADDTSQTNLIYSLSNIATLEFTGVQESAGRLPEGNYKYYFTAVDADGNETSIIEESRTVSIFSGVGKTAHSSLSGQSSKAASFNIHFSEKDSENISGINVYYSYFVGEFSQISTVHKILTTFRNKTNNTFSVIHTGLEPTEGVAVSELNVSYTPIDTAKTISQVRSRLALANVSYSSVDIQTLAEASYRIRIEEEDIVINRDYSEVFNTQSQTSDILYSTPEDIYGDDSNDQLPGIGYWREETYVGGVNWILENDFVTESFPVKGIDRVFSPTGSYTEEDSDSHDYASSPFKSTTHENRLGVYRTKASSLTDANGHLIVKKLKFTEIDKALQYLKDAGIPVKGYFFTRKDRIKDCLWEGVSGGLHRVPVVQNYQGSSVWDWGPDEPSSNNNRIIFVPAMLSQTENWEDITLVSNGSSTGGSSPNDRDEAQKDLDILIDGGLKIVPSNGGWLETVNPHIDGYEADARNPVNSSSIRDFISYQETGAYDYRIEGDLKLRNRIDGGIEPDWSKVNRVAFHSADMLVDPAGISRDFESNISFEISSTDTVEIGFKSGEVGTGGNSLVSKFYLKEKTLGTYSNVDLCKVSATLVDSGIDNPVEEAYSGKTDRNVYKYHGMRTAYEPITLSGNPVNPSYNDPSFVVSSGRYVGDGQLGGRGREFVRSLSVISTEYGSYFGCNLLDFNDINSLKEINSFNSSIPFFNTRFSSYTPNSSTYTKFGRYTRVYAESGSLRTNEDAWTALYSNLSGTYKAISRRYSIESTADVSVGEGDCFNTIAWKQLSRKRGLPNNVTDSYPTVNTYYYGIDTNDGNVTEAANLARSHTDIKSSGPLAYTQGLYIPLIHQNNNNVAVRSIENTEPTERNLVGSDREFHPYRSLSTLRSRPQIESSAYNFGLNFGSDKLYTPSDINVPAFISDFSTRVVLSNGTATAEFENGYRVFQNTNYRDYNKDYGNITKLISFNNTLYCVQEGAVSLIDVDGRTLTTEGDVGKVFIDSADLLPSTLTNISSEHGSNMFNSIIKTDVGIFGVDYIKNRPWRLTGEGLKVLSDFKTQTKFNEFKDNTKLPGSIPVVKTHFDRLTNKVYFNYSVRGGTGIDQNLVFNTNTELWVGEDEFTPSIAFNVNDAYYSLPENANTFWLHNSTPNTSFYGVTKEPSIEYVLLGENASTQIVLDNLKIVSNNVSPNRYTYTVEDLVTYNRTGNHNFTNPSFTENAIVRGDVLVNNAGDSFRANIMQANTQYKENAMDVQVGKQTTSSAKIRDKAIKIKIVYDGNNKVFIQQVLSFYRDSYA